MLIMVVIGSKGGLEQKTPALRAAGAVHVQSGSSLFLRDCTSDSPATRAQHFNTAHTHSPEHLVSLPAVTAFRRYHSHHRFSKPYHPTVSRISHVNTQQSFILPSSLQLNYCVLPTSKISRLIFILSHLMILSLFICITLLFSAATSHSHILSPFISVLKTALHIYTLHKIPPH